MRHLTLEGAVVYKFGSNFPSTHTKKNDVETLPAGLTFKCSMVFDQYIVYKLHLKASKPWNEIKKCKDCSFTSCTKAGLKAHIDSEHKINFRCTFCKASFDEFENLIKHLKEEEEKEAKKLDAVLYQKLKDSPITMKYNP